MGHPVYTLQLVLYTAVQCIGTVNVVLTEPQFEYWYVQFTTVLVCTIHNGIGMYDSQRYWCVQFTTELVCTIHNGIGMYNSQ